MPDENSRMIRYAMIEVNKLRSILLEHCEEKAVSKGAINAGEIAEKLNVEGYFQKQKKSWQQET